MNNTAIDNVINALVEGEELTAKQISARYGVANPHSVIYSARRLGYPIYLNTRRNSKGETTQKYRLGTPSRRLIAAGYKYLAMQAQGLVD